MKKLSETYRELGIDFTFPIKGKDANGNVTYYQETEGCWWKREYDSNGNVTRYETSDGYWSKYEYNANGKETYYENSDGTKRGTPRSHSCAGKVIEVDCKKIQTNSTII